MPQSISSDIIRVCKLCGKEFKPRARKQYCCGEIKVKQCAQCGKNFEYLCTTDGVKKMTCSPTCQGQYIKAKRMKSASQLTKICKWCGKEFTPKSVRDVYCRDVHYQTCLVCRKQFEIDVRVDPYVKTCSEECRYKQMVVSQPKDQMAVHIKETMIERYGVENPMQLSDNVDKIKATNKSKYGVEWYTQTQEYKDKVKQISLNTYGVEHYLQSPEVINKRVETVQEKYGVDNVSKLPKVQQQIKNVLFERYGVINVSQYSEFKAKATKHARFSKLEERICKLLDNYRIEYVHHYFLKDENISHEFDFYIPKYKLLLDADGLYFHSYLDDPDGERVRDDYDEVRLKLVPKDHIFHVIVETQEDRQVKELVDLLESISGDLSGYNSQLFEWCRSIEFPYPEYDEKRLIKDWKHLCSYSNDNYVSQCRIGISLIKQFHHSIYHCHVGSGLSPYEGWNNDSALQKVIRNRFIYKNDVDPSKVLAGFNISKIAPCVSIFNPILAKYLIKKYLDEFDKVFDPFSGFSGRMLGAASLDKGYIGHDLNPIAVAETNQIIDFLGLSRSKYNVTEDDIFNLQGNFQCLITCPPYAMKEIYGQEQTFKTCDGWIEECLTRFNCSRYVFIVDKTESYSQYVKEEIKSDSHFAHVTEKVVVIDRQ